MRGVATEGPAAGFEGRRPPPARAWRKDFHHSGGAPPAAVGRPTPCQETCNSYAAGHPEEAARAQGWSARRGAPKAGVGPHPGGGQGAPGRPGSGGKLPRHGRFAGQLHPRACLTGRASAVPSAEAKALGISTFFTKPAAATGAFAGRPPEFHVSVSAWICGSLRSASPCGAGAPARPARPIPREATAAEERSGGVRAGFRRSAAAPARILLGSVVQGTRPDPGGSVNEETAE